MNKKKIVATALVVTVLGSGMFAAKQSFAAETPSTTSQNPMSSLVQKIATKFNLNTSDVQAVFDQNRTEMEAQRETEYEARLTQDVTDGKITDAQKQLIIAKHKELDANRQANMENMKNMTNDQRKAAMEAERTALQDWAKTNSIDLKYIQFGRGGGMHGRGPGEMAPPAAQ